MDDRKNSFILYHDSLDILDDLSDEQAGKLFKIIRDYAKNKEVNIVETILKIAFTPIKNYMIRDDAKYNTRCEQNRENGKKGGRPIKAEKTQNNQTVISETERLFEKAKKPDSDSGSDSGSENETNILATSGEVAPTKIKRFVKPTIEEITQHIKEKNYDINAEQFEAYYESNGWRVGKSPMKDWKATLRNWQLKHEERNPKNRLIKGEDGKNYILFPNGERIVIF